MIKFKRFFCLLLSAAMVFLLFGCGRDEKEAASYFVKGSDEQVDVLIDDGDEKIYYDNTAREQLTVVAETDMSALLFSEESCSVSVYDEASGRLWRSIPKSYEGDKASVISLDLLIDGKEYSLNSQRDSKAMDCTSYEVKDDGIVVSYGFRRTFSDGTKIDIDVPVEYTASDGIVSVNIDCSAIEDKGNGDVVVRSISLLPFLGANRDENKGDYILLPDGSGLTLDTSAKAEAEEVFTVKSYSPDPSLYEKGDEGAYSVLSAFGMKSSKGAFVAVIDEGDAISAVKAHRASEKGGYNRVYAEFEITPVLQTENGYYVSSESYKGDISLSYRFIPSGSNGYVGMASVARELLIRNGSLTSEPCDTEGDYPFNLSIIGESDGKAYTDFAECYDIVSSLNSKGINSINLRLKGALEDNEIKESLNSKGSYDEFVRLVASKDIRVFPDCDILTDKGGNRALALDGEAAKTENDGFRQQEAALRGASAIGDTVNGLLYSSLGGDVAGICFNDAGSLLYSDFTQGEVLLRDGMKNLLHTQINSASATKEIMVSRGNLYSLKYTDVIVELDDGAFYGKTEGCTQIPFVQAVLHGSIEYSHSAINTAEDGTAAFLRALEYGAIPYYQWHSDSDDTQSPYYYLNSTAQAKQQYDVAKALFEDLRDKKITAHSQVAENVYLTVYGDRTEIYVNYGEKEVTVSGVTVEGRSFIRVN